jgi:hypothetical protein
MAEPQSPEVPNQSTLARPRLSAAAIARSVRAALKRAHRSVRWLYAPWGKPLNGQTVRTSSMQWLIDTFGFDCAIETGTFRGTTTEWLSSACRLETYSIEASWRYHLYARWRLRGIRAAHLLHDDSRAGLRRLRGRIAANARVLCYLDAHWGPDLPLREELEIVFGSWPRSVVVIDDFEVPGDPGYGFDDYGPGARIGLDLIGPPDGLDCYLPNVPADQETGARRGWAVLAPTIDRPTMAECPGVARWIADESP